jgi:hypothetical protein
MNVSRNPWAGLPLFVACSLVACSSSEGGAKNQPAEDGGVPEGDGGKVPAAEPCVADESGPVPQDRCTTDPEDTSMPQCFTWVKVEPPGAKCSDGSQYKFFVSYSNTSNDLVVSLEPGGACWDYESCSGAGGIRGAANPNGLEDNHMGLYGNLPHMTHADVNPIKDWNKVFVSYCTGDVHSGNNEMTYENPAGGEPLHFLHHGHDNVMKVIAWLKQTFTSVPKFMVTGCSAGGAGALINYHFFREGMGDQAQCGYLLDDSGPIFHSDGPSKDVHAKIRSSWNVDPILESLDGKIPVKIDDLKKDFGLINVALAKMYPSDRLALTAYRMDFNYSLYSYQRFFPGSTEEDIHAFWWKDMQGLMKTFDEYPNMAYFIPYFRNDNCSHCVSIPPLSHLDQLLTNPWYGSEIQAKGIDLKQYTIDLLDPTKPLESYVEELQASEGFTPEESTKCMEGG